MLGVVRAGRNPHRRRLPAASQQAHAAPPHITNLSE